MGVDLGELAVKNSISLDSLSGKIIAVDAFNVLYQFLSNGAIESIPKKIHLRKKDPNRMILATHKFQI